MGLADLGVMCSGGATTTVYPTTMAEDVAYILGDSGSRFVFAEDDGQVEKLRTHRHDIPDVRLVVTFTGEAHSGDEEGDDWVISWPTWRPRAVRSGMPGRRWSTSGSTSSLPTTSR